MQTIEQLIEEVSQNIENGLLVVPELLPDLKDQEVEVVKTGSSVLDDALGIGGLPVGRIVEILGENGCVDKDTRINFIVSDKKGKIINSKGGSIEYLYKRFNRMLTDSRIRNDSVISVPSFDENNKIVHRPIHSVVKTGIKECYEVVTVSGNKIIATGDHKFFIGTKFVALSKLNKGDVLYLHNNTYHVREIKLKHPRYTEEYVRYHSGNRVKIVTANNRKGEKAYSYERYRVRRSHLVIEAWKNGLSVEQYKDILNTGSKKDIDKLWVVPKGYEVHHKDRNRKNDKRNNLELLNVADHHKVHWLTNPTNCRFILSVDKISSIKSVGKRETYDIKCIAPYNNYIANKFAVHNSGKTTLASHVIANAQQAGHKCAFIDVEYAFDKTRAEAIGVQFNKLAIAQPNTAEDALQLLDTLILSGMFKVIVLDSVAALIPKAELEGEMSDSVIGLQARLMGKIMRKITGPTSKNKVLVIFTNQLRDKIGGFNPIPTKVGSGGNALKFYSTVRLDLRRTKNEKRGDKLLYTHHKVTITKNKLGVPFKVVQVKIGEKGFINDNN